MKQENEIFFRVVSESLAGALIGIVSGAILGLLIWGFQIPLNWINHLLEPAQWAEWMAAGKGEPTVMYGNQSFWPSPLFPESLGMAFGAIIGSIVGAKAAFAKYKK